MTRAGHTNAYFLMKNALILTHKIKKMKGKLVQPFLH